MSDLYVGNLSWSTTSEDLSRHLSQYGTVNNCDTGTVRNGRTRGWAIVSMGSADDAQAVIDACHDQEFDGRPLSVRHDSKPDKPARAPRASGGKGGGGGAPRGGDPALEGKAESSSGLQVPSPI